MNTLVALGGESGKAMGQKVLKSIFHSLIAPELLSSISWTGRSAKGAGTKIALCKYKGILRAIFLLCRKADKQYDAMRCEEDIKHKIIKNAPGKDVPCTTSVSQNDAKSSLFESSRQLTNTMAGSFAVNQQFTRLQFAEYLQDEPLNLSHEQSESYMTGNKSNV